MIIRQFLNKLRLFIVYGLFYIFVEKQIILIAAIQIDIEGNGRKHPKEDIFVRQESKQGATYSEGQSPICKNGHPPDI